MGLTGYGKMGVKDLRVWLNQKMVPVSIQQMDPKKKPQVLPKSKPHPDDDLFLDTSYHTSRAASDPEAINRMILKANGGVKVPEKPRAQKP